MMWCPSGLSARNIISTGVSIGRGDWFGNSTEMRSFSEVAVSGSKIVQPVNKTAHSNKNNVIDSSNCKYRLPSISTAPLMYSTPTICKVNYNITFVNWVVKHFVFSIGNSGELNFCGHNSAFEERLLSFWLSKWQIRSIIKNGFAGGEVAQDQLYWLTFLAWLYPWLGC